MMRKIMWLFVVLSLLVLAACGGESKNDVAQGAESFVSMMSAEVSPMSSSANTIVTADMTMDWAERTFPELFPKENVVYLPPIAYEGVIYNVRAYVSLWETNYLGITADGRIFGLGAFTGGILQQFETIDYWKDQVLADQNNENYVFQPQTLSTGAQHTCAVADDGQVYCWGSNSHGQAGIDTGFPAVTSPHRIDGITDAVDVSAHGWMSCAVRETGGVVCWGNNQHGVLGIGYASLGAHVLPAPVVDISNAVAVRADAYSSGPLVTCVQHADGGVSCWGINANLGDGIDYRERTDYVIKNPIRSLLSDVTELSVGYGYVCGRHSDGEVSCWGANSSGQTGQTPGFGGNLTTPMRTDWVSNVVELEVGGATSCVRTDDGKVWCWGGNTYGTVGNGITGAAVTLPVEIPALNGARQLSLGWHFGCAVTSDAKVRCWGLNSSGQLGDGTKINRSAPVEVAGLTDVVEVSAGLWHSCARRADGSVWCWGYNGDGQLGDGGRGNSLTPVQVSVLNLGER